MIRAHGNETIILGLSFENLMRLSKGQSIKFDGKEIGVPGKTVLIVAGSTEEALLIELRDAGILDPGLKAEASGSKH